MEEQITINRADFLRLITATHCAHKDAQMALKDEWDRSDEGFEDQLFLLTQALMPFEHLLDEPLEA